MTSASTAAAPTSSPDARPRRLTLRPGARSRQSGALVGSAASTRHATWEIQARLLHENGRHREAVGPARMAASLSGNEPIRMALPAWIPSRIGPEGCEEAVTPSFRARESPAANSARHSRQADGCSMWCGCHAIPIR